MNSAEIAEVEAVILTNMAAREHAGCQCGAVSSSHVYIGISNEEAEQTARDKPRVITRVMDDGVQTKDGAA